MAFSGGSTFGGFGAPAAQPSTFGGFGAATSQPSTGFSGFGAATSQPSTGFGGFGAATSQPSTGFGGFGTATSQPSTGFGGFGAATSQPSTGFGGFGAATTSQPSTVFSGFGAAATSQPSTGFGGFGAATSQPSTGFGGFGAAATQASTGFGGFGSTTSQPSTFGGFGTTTSQPSTGFGGFGTTTSQPSSGFGGFGSFGSSTAAKPTGFGTTGGMFGGAGTGLSFGQPQQQQQQPQQTQVNNAIFFLRASWGFGKAYYSNSAQPIQIKPENPFCRFKSIGYSAMPQQDDKEGLVGLMFKKKQAELEAGKPQITASLTQTLGNRQNMKINIENIKSSESELSEVVVSVDESLQTGGVRRIPASELSAFLNQTMQVQSLKNLGVEMVIPQVKITEEDLKEYLASPPAGVDPRLWKQAQLDNPDSKSFIPVPIIGFKALYQRIKIQENQSKSHQGRLDCIAENISELQKKNQNTLAALAEAKRKQLELSHRYVKVTVQNVCLLQVRLQSQSSVLSGNEKYTLDQFAVSDVKSVLRDQQQAIQALVSVIKEDMKDLNIMVDGLSASDGSHQ
ncbi:probable nucleoporin Nup54 [Eurytemora carolleeae]|uniref:probable nucleoporin Nup54 n=1 Tax=Eurytemora carolleeae TaxID=1294199 RepID=UPI000C788569|nr:probable nucleoporin Nup54 [Eurytemora carolleeae]|eukprot:XP_023338811.1 probable nucleoporin Nup54 [Eurytemora affinis]